MDRKAIARQTLDIMEKGWYETEGTVVEIRARQQESVKNSVLSLILPAPRIRAADL